jgi:hypothetical protein
MISQRENTISTCWCHHEDDEHMLMFLFLMKVMGSLQDLLTSYIIDSRRCVLEARLEDTWT